MLWLPRANDDDALIVAEFEGGFRPPPIPPGYQGLPQGLPTTQTIESFNGPWSNGSSWGRQVEYTYPARTSADPIAVFSIDRQPGPPRARCLHLFRSDHTLISGAFNAEVYAKLTYGVGGIQNVAFLDWTRGGQFSLVCDSLKVEAVAYAPSASSAYAPPGGSQILGAMLGHEGVGVSRAPTFTTQVIDVAPNLIASFPVPDFARYVYPRVCSHVPIDAGDFMVFASLFAVGLGRFTLTEALTVNGTALSGGTTEVNLRHDAAAPLNQSYCVAFELGL